MVVDGLSIFDISQEVGLSTNALYRLRRNLDSWFEYQDQVYQKRIQELESQLRQSKESKVAGRKFDRLRKKNQELLNRVGDLKSELRIVEKRREKVEAKPAYVSAVKVTKPLPDPVTGHSPRHKFPKNRGECWHGANEERPCPWVRCRHHLAVKSIDWKQVHLIAEPEDMDHTCALDVAESGPKTLEEIGEILGLTRERVRQIQDVALEKLLDRFPELLTEMRWDV